MRARSVAVVLGVLACLGPAVVEASGEAGGRTLNADDLSSLGSENRVALAARLVRRLDRPAPEYLVTVRTLRTSRSREALRRLGFTVEPSGGPFAPVDAERARVSLWDALGRSRSATTQHLRVRAGGQAEGFQGVAVPVVTTTQYGPYGASQVATVEAGDRLRVRAIRPLGREGVELGLSTEQSAVVQGSGPYPTKRQAVFETTVQARFGCPVVVAGHDAADEGFAGDGGLTGSVVIEESGPWGTRRQVSIGGGGRRRHERGTILVELTVRPAAR